MTLYTVVPIELVWDGGLREYPVLEEISMNGVLMQVQRLENNQMKIERVLNCSLEQYLNPSYAPGQIIRMRPE